MKEKRRVKKVFKSMEKNEKRVEMNKRKGKKQKGK